MNEADRVWVLVAMAVLVLVGLFMIAYAFWPSRIARWLGLGPELDQQRLQPYPVRLRSASPWPGQPPPPDMLVTVEFSDGTFRTFCGHGSMWLVWPYLSETSEAIEVWLTGRAELIERFGMGTLTRSDTDP